MTTRHKAAFTLIELLVSVGIIGLLIALLLPMIFKASRQATKTRIASDLQVISQALNHYKDDFGDYPRLDYTYSTGTGADASTSGSSGAALLGKALLGPANDAATTPLAPAYSSSTVYKAGDFVSSGTTTYVSLISENTAAVSDTNRWTPFWVYDGADGPGFKSRTGASKTWGPYVDPGAVKHQGICLTDHLGGVILYFAARKPKPNLTTVDASNNDAHQPYIGYMDLSGSTPAARWTGSNFNATDNLEYFRRLSPTADSDTIALRRVRLELADYNANGYIDLSEVAIEQPFALISPGSDGVYGPPGYVIPTSTMTANDAKDAQAAFEACDDVNNFKTGQ